MRSTGNFTICLRMPRIRRRGMELFRYAVVCFQMKHVPFRAGWTTFMVVSGNPENARWQLHRRRQLLRRPVEVLQYINEDAALSFQFAQRLHASPPRRASSVFIVAAPSSARRPSLSTSLFPRPRPSGASRSAR